MKQDNSETVLYGDWTVGQLLRNLGPEHRLRRRLLRKKFLANPYLDTITLKEIVENPISLVEFLGNLIGIPYCGADSKNFVQNILISVVNERLDLRHEASGTKFDGLPNAACGNTRNQQRTDKTLDLNLGQNAFDFKKTL